MMKMQAVYLVVFLAVGISRIDGASQKYKRAVSCPSEKQTVTHKCCYFPFIYKGKTYDSCTSVNHHQPWCSLTHIYEGSWDNCVTCPPGKQTVTHKCCFFPFVYKGKTYRSCTSVDHNQPWCALTHIYQKGKWDNCA